MRHPEGEADDDAGEGGTAEEEPGEADGETAGDVSDVPVVPGDDGGPGAGADGDGASPVSAGGGCRGSVAEEAGGADEGDDGSSRGWGRSRRGRGAGSGGGGSAGRPGAGGSTLTGSSRRGTGAALHPFGWFVPMSCASHSLSAPAG